MALFARAIFTLYYRYCAKKLIVALNLAVGGLFGMLEFINMNDKTVIIRDKNDS